MNPDINNEKQNTCEIIMAWNQIHGNQLKHNDLVNLINLYCQHIWYITPGLKKVIKLI